MAKWQGELAEVRGMLADVDENARPKSWKKKCEFSKADVVGKLHMVLDTVNDAVEEVIRKLVQNPKFEEAILKKIGAGIDTSEVEKKIEEL